MDRPAIYRSDGHQRGSLFLLGVETCRRPCVSMPVNTCHLQKDVYCLWHIQEFTCRPNEEFIGLDIGLFVFLVILTMAQSKASKHVGSSDELIDLQTGDRKWEYCHGSLYFESCIFWTGNKTKINLWRSHVKGWSCFCLALYRNLNHGLFIWVDECSMFSWTFTAFHFSGGCRIWRNKWAPYWRWWSVPLWHEWPKLSMVQMQHVPMMMSHLRPKSHTHPPTRRSVEAVIIHHGVCPPSSCHLDLL